MIVVAGGIKGGSGKSTAAVTLAAMRALAGRDVLLVDADEQGTASDFSTLRAERAGPAGRYTHVALRDRAVRTEVLRLRDKYDDVVVDTGGRDTSSQRAALTVADVLIVPFVPRSFDVWTLEKVAALVEEVQAVNPSLRAYAFLNRADPAGRDNADAAAALADAAPLRPLPLALGNRKAFANAAAEGLSVVELRPADPKASAEAGALYQAVFGDAFGAVKV